MGITILTKELEGIISLQGIEGESSVYTKDSKLYIKGKISLIFHANGKVFTSRPGDIAGDKISIIESDGNYYLAFVVGFQSFTFDTLIVLYKNEISPILYISEIAISKSTVLEISLEKIALSIEGPVTAPDTAILPFYANGINPLNLLKMPSPVSRRLGFYLEKTDNSILVEIGAPGTAISLNVFKSVSLNFTGNTLLSYDLTRFNLSFNATANGRHYIQFDGKTEWELDSLSPTGTSSSLEITKLVCEDGWITSAGFPTAEVTISKKSTGVPHKGQRTKIFTGVERIKVYYPMGIKRATLLPNLLTKDNQQFIDVPQIVYESRLDAIESTIKEQHYGIRIQHLTNDKGVSVKLDADLAVIRLDDASGEMYLHAGTGIKVRGKDNTPAILMPKRNISEAGKRIVKIPCLPAVVCVQEVPGKSSFELDTKMNKFSIKAPQLETSPFAPGNLDKADQITYNKLNWITKKDEIEFLLTGDIVKPKDPEWLQSFNINPATSVFNLLDNQRAVIQYDPPPQHKLMDPEVTVTIITTRKVDETEREKITYLAYAGILGFSASWLAGGLICDTVNPYKIYTCLQKEGKEYININFDTQREDAEKVKEWLLNRNVNELVIAYYKNDPKLQKFIDDNIKVKEPTDEKPTSIAFWPVTNFIGIPLIIKKKGGTTSYCYDIIKQHFNDSSIRCGIGIDQNQSAAIDLENTFGFTKTSFKNFASSDEFKVLFPYYNKGMQPSTANGLTDPTDPKFCGVIFKNMPLMLNVPTDKLPSFLSTLIEKINENLFLDFGWRNDRGFTWIARIPEAVTSKPDYNGIDILRNGIIKFNVSDIRSIGSDSRLIKFSFDTSIGLFAEGDPTDNKYKIDVDANASITFNDKTIDNCILIPKSSYVKPIADIIPGFDYIRFNRFETNGKQLMADVELYPDVTLAQALPIFEKYKKTPDDPNTFNPAYVLKTAIAIDLENGSAVISVIINTTTRVFGKWALSIRALNIFIKSTNGNRLEVTGDFNLGLENFIKVGGRIIVQHNAASGWDYDMHLDKIGGSLALSGEVKLSGEMAWGEIFPDNPSDPPKVALRRDELITKGKSRDFYGILYLKSPGIFGNAIEMFVKIASKEGVPQWVCGLKFGGDINLGFAKLKEPELYVVKNSDFGGKIDSIVTDVNGGIQTLRKDDNVSRETWLQGAEFSDKTGFTIVASGYLVYELLNGLVTQKPDDKNFTALLYSSAGIIRIEGYIKMFPSHADVQVLFTIDLRKKRILVGFQLPKFFFPNEKAPSKFIFQPGQMLLGTSFGGPFYFLSSFGWPPQTGDSYERDWSKSNRLTYQPASPPFPNDFAGGGKFEFDAAEKFIVYGIAFKAGWKYDVGFGIGKAGLELSFGGLLVIKAKWGDDKFEQVHIRNFFGSKRIGGKAPNLSNMLVPANDDISAFISESYWLIKRDIERASRNEVAILGELFADIKGYAEVKIFDITLAGVYLHAYARLQICGDTKEGITRIAGAFGAEFCVKIGCVTYCKSAQIDIVIVPGKKCDAESLNYQFLPQLN